MRVSTAKRQLNAIDKMIEESPELDERQFRSDLQELPVPSLQATLRRLDEQRERLRVMGQLPLLPAQREENERKMSAVRKKVTIVNQIINETRDPERGKEGSVGVKKQLAFDEDEFRRQLRGEGRATLEQMSTDLLKDKQHLVASMSESWVTPQRRQGLEFRLSVVDKKRAILLEMIKRKEDFDEKSYRAQLYNLPPTALRDVMSTLQREQTKLRTEMISSPSVEKKKKEEELTILRIKRRAVEGVLQQRSNEGKELESSTVSWRTTEMSNREQRKKESVGESVQPAFDADVYQEQLRERGKVARDQELAGVLRERKSVLESMNEVWVTTRRRQDLELQLSVVDQKWAILLEMINLEEEFKEMSYRAQVQNLPLTTLHAVMSTLHREQAKLRTGMISSSSVEKKKKEEEIKILRIKHKVVEEVLQQRSNGGKELESSTVSWRANEMSNREQRKRESVGESMQPAFDVEVYQEQVRERGKGARDQELAGVLRERKSVLESMNESWVTTRRRQDLELQLSIVDKKWAILLEMINREEEFDEMSYRAQFQNLPFITLQAVMSNLLEEQKKLRTKMMSLFSSVEKRKKEEEMTILRTKRKVVEELIQQRSDIGRDKKNASYFSSLDEERYRSQLRNLPLAALQRVMSDLQEEEARLRKEAYSSISSFEKKRREEEIVIVQMKFKVVEGLVQRLWNEGATNAPEPEPLVEVDTPFKQEDYQSQFRNESLENLQRERHSLLQENIRLVQEMQGTLSPEKRGATEKQLSIVGKKRVIVNSLMHEAEERAIYSQVTSTSSARSPAHPSNEKWSAAPSPSLLLDTSEEIVDVVTSLRPLAPHPINMGGNVAKADLLSTETFDDGAFSPTRPDPTATDAFYWSSEILD
ncbi:hypothetical protein FS842_002742 [Serendipita sp. 407]|nr:hypothetical protein FRC15_004510 [Serendipita sp. 397]KAG9041056.1 hypothetical protein FS842_002742 [Serendipita sp. 407]